RLHRNDTAKLRATHRRDVAETVLLEPAAAFFGNEHAGDWIHAAGDTLAGHHNVRHHTVAHAGPHLATTHQARLDLVGDVQRIVALAQFLDRRQVPLMRHRETIGRRDRLHDHGRHVALA